jgi:cytoskeletal protein RodZ
LENVPSHLVDLANQRGGHDNITVLTLEVPPRPDITRPLHPSVPAKVVPAKKRPRIAVSCLTVTILLAALLLLVSLLIWTFFRPVQSTPTLTPSPMASPTLVMPVLPGSLPTRKPDLTSTPKPGSPPTPSPLPASATYTPWPTSTNPP